MNTNKIEIILVEDNLSDAKLTIMALQDNNITNNIVHLKDGEEAIDYIFRIGMYENLKNELILPRLILLDLKMPKVNGIEVLRKLKSNDETKILPVAVFTSSQEDPDVKECYALGVNSYIVKPMDFDAFAKVVKETGLYWSLVNHLPK